jgi:hypothetical protein
LEERMMWTRRGNAYKRIAVRVNYVS